MANPEGPLLLGGGGIGGGRSRGRMDIDSEYSGLRFCGLWMKNFQRIGTWQKETTVGGRWMLQ